MAKEETSTNKASYDESELFQPSNEDTDEADITMGPYAYIRENTVSKDWRGKVLNVLNSEVFGIGEDRLQGIKDAIGILHDSSLIIDDIEDDSKVRRDKPCAHRIFGVAQAINSANYMYFKAMEKIGDVFEDHRVQALEIFQQEMLNLHRGQGMELYWRDDHIRPTVDEYLQMASNKTGGLFRMAIKLMQLAAGWHLGECQEATDMGILYQLRDDYLNLTVPGSRYLDDITEGKCTYPIIIALENLGAKESHQLCRILKLRTDDSEIKEMALKLIQQSGALEETKSAINKYESTVYGLLAEWTHNAEDSQVLAMVKLLGAVN